jgi:hypothetical protein
MREKSFNYFKKALKIITTCMLLLLNHSSIATKK